MTQHRPVVALAMRTGLPEQLFVGRAQDRLRAVAAVDPSSPWSTWDDARASGSLGDVEVLVTGWGIGRIDARVLDDAPALRAIIHAAGSVKGLLDPVCWERGLAISTAAEANAVPVAEYTLAAVLLAGKRAFLAAARASGRASGPVPTASTGAEAVGNYGRTVGVVGASRVGRRVLAALQSVNLEVLLHDPFIDAAEAAAMGAHLVPLDELVSAADIVTLHAPAVSSTHHLLDARRLGLMRDGATLINTARGWLVDHDALTAEVVAGRLHAVLDVTEPEPLPPGHPLLSSPNALITPHVAGALGTELQRLGDWAVDELERYAAGEAFAAPVMLADFDRIA